MRASLNQQSSLINTAWSPLKRPRPSVSRSIKLRDHTRSCRHAISNDAKCLESNSDQINGMSSLVEASEPLVADTDSNNLLDGIVRTLIKAALILGTVFLLPSSAHAEGLSAPSALLEFVLDYVQNLGPLGPLAFVATVAIAECIPLFPTQPLSLASGILFGAQQGAVCMLIGNCLAALIAFSVARGVGRPLAERIIKSEMADASKGPAAKLRQVTEAIERGTFWQQAGAILALRMTPVVPYSASNYVLGLSPLPLLPYMTGTFAGMCFWAPVYATAGHMSRSLVQNGRDDTTSLLDTVIEKGEGLSLTMFVVVAVIIGAAVAVSMLSAPKTDDQVLNSSDEQISLRIEGELVEHGKGE